MDADGTERDQTTYNEPWLCLVLFSLLRSKEARNQGHRNRERSDAMSRAPGPDETQNT